MKLVVDVHVLVSGSLWSGNPSRLVDALLDGSATLCASASVLAEFEEVIQRDKFKMRLEERGRSAVQIISQFRASSLIVEAPAIALPARLRDPDDVHVLACALCAGAEAIVSGDNDLLSLETFQGVPIITVRQALARLGIPTA